MPERITLDESSAQLQKTIDRMSHYLPKENRGVKLGSKRGRYFIRKHPQKAEFTCKECGRVMKYAKLGRMKKFCSARCKQRNYRDRKKKADIERRAKLM
jgi:hypothetical protein